MESAINHLSSCLIADNRKNGRKKEVEGAGVGVGAGAGAGGSQD